MSFRLASGPIRSLIMICDASLAARIAVTRSTCKKIGIQQNYLGNEIAIQRPPFRVAMLG